MDASEAWRRADAAVRAMGRYDTAHDLRARATQLRHATPRITNAALAAALADGLMRGDVSARDIAAGVGMGAAEAQRRADAAVRAMGCDDTAHDLCTRATQLRHATPGITNAALAAALAAELVGGTVSARGIAAGGRMGAAEAWRRADMAVRAMGHNDTSSDLRARATQLRNSTPGIRDAALAAALADGLMRGTVSARGIAAGGRMGAAEARRSADAAVRALGRRDTALSDNARLRVLQNTRQHTNESAATALAGELERAGVAQGDARRRAAAARRQVEPMGPARLADDLRARLQATSSGAALAPRVAVVLGPRNAASAQARRSFFQQMLGGGARPAGQAPAASAVGAAPAHVRGAGAAPARASASGATGASGGASIALAVAAAAALGSASSVDAAVGNVGGIAARTCFERFMSMWRA